MRFLFAVEKIGLRTAVPRTILQARSWSPCTVSPAHPTGPQPSGKLTVHVPAHRLSPLHRSSDRTPPWIIPRKHQARCFKLRWNCALNFTDASRRFGICHCECR